jgi:hypothetical protein
MTIRIDELEKLIEPPWDGKRPPYGETDPKFDLESARATLTALEHEPASQANSDTLFVELRLACEYVAKIQPLLDAVPVLLDFARAALKLHAQIPKARDVMTRWHDDYRSGLSETALLDEALKENSRERELRRQYEGALSDISL